VESDFLSANIEEEREEEKKRSNKREKTLMRKKKGNRHVSSSREEEISIFVERNGHDTIAEVKRILNTIAMVDINVDVQHSGVVPIDVMRWIEMR